MPQGDLTNSILLALALLLGLGLALLWLRRFRVAQQREKARPAALFASLLPLLEGAKIKTAETVGTYVLTGRYKSRDFQVKVIVDTLAARKLPSLWLMVTRASPQPVDQVFDFMMRPAGPSTFSKFDFLPHALPLPPGFPEHMVLRSDHPSLSVAIGLVPRLMPLFTQERGKELLISPKGLRHVTQLAEADRLRYGVFRQPDFGEAVIPADRATQIFDALIWLEDELAKPAKPEINP